MPSEAAVGRKTETAQRHVLGRAACRRRPARISGFDPAAFVGAAPDQVLRNQSVGSRCSDGRSGPRLATVIADQNVVGRGLGVFDEDVEVAVVVEDARVDQFELRLLPASAAGSPRPAAS